MEPIEGLSDEPAHSSHKLIHLFGNLGQRHAWKIKYFCLCFEHVILEPTAKIKLGKPRPNSQHVLELLHKGSIADHGDGCLHQVVWAAPKSQVLRELEDSRV